MTDIIQSEIVEEEAIDIAAPQDRDDDLKLGDWVFIPWEDKRHSKWIEGDDSGCDDEDCEGCVSCGHYEEWFTPREDYLGCVSHIGSNYVEFSFPSRKQHGLYPMRIHNDDLLEKTRVVPQAEAQAHIAGKIEHYRGIVRGHLSEIERITHELGTCPKIGHSPEAPSTTAIARISGDADPNAYKKSLIKAKEEDLPELFTEVDKATDWMTMWLKANTVPLQAEVDRMSGAIGQVEDRIHNVELYAGLLEDVRHVKRGKPAPATEKLHLFQRRMYMDEECLAGYTAGGIDCESIQDFDKWLKKAENLNRIMPFPRCMVAFKVRRESKEREGDGTLTTALINLQLAQMDGWTFLYIRNGGNLYRLQTEHEFGSSLFPGRDEFDFSQPKYGVTKDRYGEGDWDFITAADYEEQLAAEEERQRKSDEWQKAYRKRSRSKKGCRYESNPYERSVWDREKFEPFDSRSVYHDDMVAYVDRVIQDYNRISLIIQGVYDRTTILAPHNKVKTWKPRSFAENVELVYQDRALFDGEPPDILEYLATGRETLRKGCVTYGQQRAWYNRVQARENDRRMGDWRIRDQWREVHSSWSPLGDPGPGNVAVIGRWQPGVKKATFYWKRAKARQAWPEDLTPTIDDRIVVEADKLFNIWAYEPGDFKKFYADPRTRRNYLKWAHMLLVAEEYYAGNLEIKP